MGGYYRLSDLGFKRAGGTHVLPKAAFAPVDEATQLLAAAEAKAADIVKEAEAAFEREKQRGYDEGRAQAQLESVERLIGEQQVLDRGLERVEQDLARLVAECVRRVIDGFDDHARAEGIVRGALKRMRREKRVELRAPSGLHKFLRGRIDTIRKDFPEIDLIDVIEDPVLDEHRVIIETSIGRVDGNLAQRLDDLETVIRGAYSKAKADAVAARPGNADAEAEQE